MSSEIRRAPGLRADWLNGWLAAIGITVLLEDVTLHWSDDVIPVALLGCMDCDALPRRVAGALPDRERLDDLPIARTMNGFAEYPRKVGLDQFLERANYERSVGTSILAATSTDLVPSKRVLKDGVEHAPLNPPVPRGITLWERACSTLEQLGDDAVGAVDRTLEGSPLTRTPGQGLAFDILRVPSGANAGSPTVDPVIELLSLAALELFPVRGDGYASRQRLWTDRPNRRHALKWVSWNVPLDRWGIDAILDRPTKVPTVHMWGSVPYVPATSSDTTRGYGSEVLM